MNYQGLMENFRSRNNVKYISAILNVMLYILLIKIVLSRASSLLFY